MQGAAARQWIVCRSCLGVAGRRGQGAMACVAGAGEDGVCRRGWRRTAYVAVGVCALPGVCRPDREEEMFVRQPACVAGELAFVRRGRVAPREVAYVRRGCVSPRGEGVCAPGDVCRPEDEAVSGARRDGVVHRQRGSIGRRGDRYRGNGGRRDDDDASSMASGASRRGWSRNRKRCFECGECGHIARFCREKKEEETPLLADAGESAALL